MGFLNMADSPGYHHAIVLSPATYARHMFPGDIAQNEVFWKSEDSAWHLATQLMSRYSTLAVLGFRASFSVPADVWKDATRLNACFFSQASRIILLVPTDAETHIEVFTRTCLSPLLTNSEEQGGHPEWRDRFIVAVIGNVRVPSELAPGIPFVKVIRFREIGWVRDITAMMLLHRAIQDYWVPSHANVRSTRPYWNWAGGSAQSSCQMSETIETKTSLGVCTHVSGQMQPINFETGRSKSVDSRLHRRRSSSRRRPQSKPPTTSSRSRSRSQHSNSSGYRSLDPEFEAQQTEELMVDTRVINVLDGSQPIYLVDAAPRKEKVHDEHKPVTSTMEDTIENVASGEEHVTDKMAARLSPTGEKNSKEHSKSHAQYSAPNTLPLRVETENLSLSTRYEKTDAMEGKLQDPFSLGSLSEESSLNDDLTTIQENSVCAKSNAEFSKSDRSEVNTVIEAERIRDVSQAAISSSTKPNESHIKVISSSQLVKEEQHSEKQDNQWEKSEDFTEPKEEQSAGTKSCLHNSVEISSSPLEKPSIHREMAVNKLVCSPPRETANESVACSELPPTLITRSSGKLKVIKSKSPPPALPPKTKARFIFSQMYFKKKQDQENSVDFKVPYIDSESISEKQKLIPDTKRPYVETISQDIRQTNERGIMTKNFDQNVTEGNEANLCTGSSLVNQHYWSVISTPYSPVTKVTPLSEAFPHTVKKEDFIQHDHENLLAPNSEITGKILPTVKTRNQDTAQDEVKFEPLEAKIKSEPLSLVHHIPVVLAPTLKETPNRKVLVHETFTEPSAPNSVRPSAVQTRSLPVRIERVASDTAIESTTPLMKKKHVSYSTETITVSERTETSSRIIPLGTGSNNWSKGEHHTDSAHSASPVMSTRNHSVTPVRSASSLTTPGSSTVAQDQDLTSMQSLQTTTTPSGRVLYFRSAVPSRLSSKDFGSRKLPRSQSTDRVRLAEPSVLSGSFTDSPTKNSRPRVHIYPSPWRPLRDETVADAGTQMAGPLASGYMKGEGVRCYAFTGTHYCKRAPQTPHLVLYKDTAIWTGPDAGETYRLEVLFATRPGLMREKDEVKQSKESRSETSGLMSNRSFTVTTPTVLSLTRNRTGANRTIIVKTSEKHEEAHRCWTILLYIFSCFVALVALAVAFFCLSTDSETNGANWSTFITWLNSSILLRRQ
ncbi:putative serine-rich repeat protein [Fasciola gigantica]|uniref:Putative serine-rich repeat protein n=1 Tax=Fasciola gigantica TaxID=46835 RepID=A0A504Z064_FASGI|nr:putative serine-rich repeat protein [Fasciola gigantica]